MLVIGIETSCDETSVAIVSSDRDILTNKVFSQVRTHRPYGGVVPELASRGHLDRLDYITRLALDDACISMKDIDAVAVTGGPGLIGSIIVGVTYAKAISASMNIPFLAVNHLAAHALTARLTHRVSFPYCLLLISGGHCQLLIVRGINQYDLLGSTLDDSVGECFDKVARLLGLPYPGGPHIERMAKTGDSSTIRLPKPLLLHSNPEYRCSFSFSGLKTAVDREVNSKILMEKGMIENICASFQKTVAEILVNRSSNALKLCKKNNVLVHSFVIAGGVASNLYLRFSIKSLVEGEFNLVFVAPPVNLCTDNAAMVAWVGIEKLILGQSSSLSFVPHHRWKLT